MSNLRKAIEESVSFYNLWPWLFSMICALFLVIKIRQSGMIMSGDSAQYLRLAKSFSEGHFKTESWPPAYPALIALISLIFKISFIQSAQFLHILLFALNGGLWVLLIRKNAIFKPVFQVFFSVLILSFLSYRIESQSLMAELPFVTFIFLWLLYFPLRTAIKLKNVLFISIVTALACYVKPSALAFIPVTLFVMIFHGHDRRTRFKNISFFICITFILFIPAMLLQGNMRISNPNYDILSILNNIKISLNLCGGVFSGFMIQDLRYPEYSGWLFIGTLGYMVMIIRTIWFTLKFSEQNAQLIAAAYFIPVYLFMYIGITSVTAPQINPRTLLFPNLILLYLMVWQAQKDSKLGKGFLGLLLLFFLAGTARTLQSNPTFSKQPGLDNHILYTIDSVAGKLKLKTVYADSLKNIYTWNPAFELKEMPGVTHWKGNNPVFFSAKYRSDYYPEFLYTWCHKKNSLLLFQIKENTRIARANCDCTPKIIHIGDSEIWLPPDQ